MAIEQVDLDRVLVLAGELRGAGRERDAGLLAKLVNEALGEARLAISAPELEECLEAAEADIAAGRVVAHEAVWEATLARRRAVRPRSGNAAP